MKTVALTGSIAMGKTDTARLFSEAGIPVFDSDKAVHELYRRGGKAVALVRNFCPEVVVDGAVDRGLLAAAVVDDPSLLNKLETAVHPLVRKELDKFLEEQRRKKKALVVVDVPLLFETGREKEFEAVVVVSAPADVQKDRALARPGMTERKFRLILSRQVPDSVKRAKADYVVETGKGHDFSRSQVGEIVNQLSKV